MYDLADLLHSDGKLDEAERFYREALEGQLAVSWAPRVQRREPREQPGSVPTRQGKNNEAGPLYRHALETQRRTLGSCHRDTLLSMVNLAEFLSNRENLEDQDEAERLYREATVARRRVLGARPRGAHHRE